MLLTSIDTLGRRPFGIGGGAVGLGRPMPTVKQDAFLRCTCGPASLEAVLRYWLPVHAATSQTELNTAMQAAYASYLQHGPNDPWMQWNDPSGMASVAQGHGLQARIERGSLTPASTPTALARWLANGETVILHRLLDGHSAEEGHYTVLTGVDAHGVHMMDPWPDSPAQCFVPWSTFLQQFQNAMSPGGQAVRVSGFALR
ncbi:MAG TPA: C39 family peptidase, partial [Myxococcota bacterium]